jgi:hypothetical protein
MARWAKRIAACKYANLGRTKIDELIAEGHLRAKKEPGGHSAPVYIDLDSIDEFFANLPDQKLQNPRRQKSGQHAA